MLNNGKRILSLLLAIIIVYNTTGYFLVSFCQRISIYSDNNFFKESIPGNHTVLHLTLSEAVKCRVFTSDEFELNGNWYDLVSVKLNRFTVDVTCFHDKDDTFLFSSLAAFIKYLNGHKGKVVKVQKALFAAAIPAVAIKSERDNRKVNRELNELLEVQFFPGSDDHPPEFFLS
jgi:hypothetical protein